jgi:hypothetical protein
MDDNNLDSWLETKFREYYPDTKSFFVGANDDDCLTLNADDHGMTWTQTLDNMGESDAEFFVFQSDETGRIITIPLPPRPSPGRSRPT